MVVAVVAAAVALPRVSHIGCKPPGGPSEKPSAERSNQ